VKGTLIPLKSQQKLTGFEIISQVQVHNALGVFTTDTSGGFRHFNEDLANTGLLVRR
jgi:hypothetical protein